MANKAQLGIIEIPHFPTTATLAGSGQEFVVITKADGTTYKMLTSDFKAFLGTVTVTSPRPIGPADATPELDGVYIPTIVGTYPNFGGLERLESDGYVQFIKNGAVYAKVNTPLPSADLSTVIPKTAIENTLTAGGAEKVASAETVKTLNDNIESFAAVTIGNNLFDKEEAVGGKGVSVGTNPGIRDAAENSWITGYIPVDEGKTYTSSINSLRAVGFANIGDTSAIQSFSAKPFTIPSGSGIKYIVLNVTTTQGSAALDTFMFNEGAIALPYEPYLKKWEIKESALPPIPVPDNVLKDEDLSVSVISNQQFEKDRYLTGFIINSSGELVTSSAGPAFTTERIKLPTEVTHVSIGGLREGIAHRVAFHGTNLNPVQSATSFTTSVTVQRPANAEYVLVYFKTATEPDDSPLDTLVINFSDHLLPQDEYKEGLTAIKGYNLAGQEGGDQPSGGGDVKYADLYKERLSINENYVDIQMLKQETAETIDSLLELQSVESGEMEIDIPAQSESKDNVLLKMHLHWGAQRGDTLFDEIFLNENCRKDFSDIRFEDEEGSLLDFNIHATGNYDVIRDSRIREANAINSIGYIVASDSTKNLGYSKDNGNTWINLGANMNIVMVDSLDNLFAYDRVLMQVFKFDLVGGDYVNQRMVLDLTNPASTVSPLNSSTEDLQGNLFIGKYQTIWDTEIFKSTDRGETWNTCYKSYDNQHVHHVTVDPYTGWIYAGLDGNVGSPTQSPKCIVSKDNGTTWETVDIPYTNTDYGLAFGGDGYRLGHGETTILGGNTIYRTTDNINYEVVLHGQQGVRKIVDFNEMLIAGGNAAHGNQVAQLYGSYDKGLSWRTFYAENFAPVPDAGAGVRWFSNIGAPNGEAEGQILVGGRYGGPPEQDYKPLRIYRGGDNYHALVYVKVGSVPVSGKTIKIKYGYAVKYPKRLIQADLSQKTGLLFRLKTDEMRGNILKDSVSVNLYQLDGEYSWFKEANRYGSVYPYEKRPISSAIVFGTSRIQIDSAILPNESFTLIFWANMLGKSDGDKKILFGDPDGVHLYIQSYRIYISDGTNIEYVNCFFYQRFSDHFGQYAVIFDKPNKILTVYYDDGQVYDTSIQNWDDAKVSEKTIIGGHSIPVSDIRLYNRVLSEKEIREIYFGGNQVI